MGTRRALIAIERELEWYFCCGSQVLGYHGASLESSGGAVWDSYRLERLHLGRLEWEHRRRLREVTAIERALGALSTEHHALVIAAFTPRPWDAALVTASGKVGENGTLAGLVVTSPEARAQFLERRKRAPHDLTELCRHLSEFARTDARAKVFRPLVDAARRALDGALEAYLGQRQNQRQDARQERRQALRAFVEGLSS